MAMQATGAERGVIALKEDYEEALSALQRTLRDDQSIALHPLGSFYPSGDEFILVHDVLGRVVPEGGIPLDVGVLVNNVGTLYNVAQATEGIPVTHRYLTVAGEVRNPMTVRVPVGTLIEQVVEWAGGTNASGRLSEPDGLAFVTGGAMMGHVAQGSDVVTKTTGGLLVLAVDSPVVAWMSRPLRNAVRRGMSTCDQCRDCTDLCPRFLLGHALQPHQIMRSVNYGLTEPTHIFTAATLCCECRLCEAYACPLGLSPMAYYRSVKKALREAGWTNTAHRRRDLTPHDMFCFRRVPMNRLIDRLGLTEYRDKPVPLNKQDLQPKEVHIPLKQHIGAPATPLVRAGESVKWGALIAEPPEGQLGANVHASVSGQVVDITDEHIRIKTG